MSGPGGTLRNPSGTTGATGPTGPSGFPELVNIIATSGAAQTIPAPTTQSASVITLTAACTLTFPTEPSSGSAVSFTLVLIQDGTGGRVVTWPAEGSGIGKLMWPGSAGPPTLSVAAAAIDVFTFTSYGAGWLAFASGLNMG